MLQTVKKIFDQPIYTYTRAQAIADGVLVDLNIAAPDAAQLFKYPVVVTAGVWNLIMGAVNDPRHCCDITGVSWDICYMATLAAKASRDPQLVEFTVAIVGHGKIHDRRLWITCGPGDEGEPVITIMRPEDY